MHRILNRTKKGLEKTEKNINYSEHIQLYTRHFDKSTSATYIKRFVRYTLYDSQSVFRFSLRLHFQTNFLYRVHKGCSYKVFKSARVQAK